MKLQWLEKSVCWILLTRTLAKPIRHKTKVVKLNTTIVSSHASSIQNGSSVGFKSLMPLPVPLSMISIVSKSSKEDSIY